LQQGSPVPMPQHHPVHALSQQMAVPQTHPNAALAPQSHANITPLQIAPQLQSQPHLTTPQLALPQQMHLQHASVAQQQQQHAASMPTLQHTPPQAQQPTVSLPQVPHQQPPMPSPRRPQPSSPASPAHAGNTPQMTRQAAGSMPGQAQQQGLAQPLRSPNAQYDARLLGQGGAPLQTSGATAGVQQQQQPTIPRPAHPHHQSGKSSPQPAAAGLALPLAGGNASKKRIFAIRGSSSTDPVRPTNNFKHLQRHGSEPAGLASLAGGGAAGGGGPSGLSGGGGSSAAASDRLAQLANEWKLQQSLVQLLLDSVVRSAPVVAASRELRRVGSDASAAARQAQRRNSAGESGTAVPSPGLVSRPATPSTDLAHVTSAELSEVSYAPLAPAHVPLAALVGGTAIPSTVPSPASVASDTTQPQNAVPHCAGAQTSSCAASVGSSPSRGEAPQLPVPNPAADVERFTSLARELLELTSENARLRRENMELLRDFRETRLRPQASTPRAVPAGGGAPSAAGVGASAASTAPPSSAASEAGAGGLSGLGAAPSVRATDSSHGVEGSRAADVRCTDASDNLSELSSATVASECA
jgi:hypothetical protein